MKKFKDYFITIGLEIHVALKTKEKLFSSTPNNFEAFSFELLDAGTPGVLPVLSQEPVEMAIAFGLAVNAEIKKESFFERKHYFYPDLPLGYQITQQHHPILIGGEVVIKDELGQNCLVKIEHAHLECDAAKSIHDLYPNYSAIDVTRCASPLLEIVSTPCLHSPQEAKEYARKIHAMTYFMGICDGKLEEGSFRVDASISLSKDEYILGTRVEIKNISSFGFLEDALNHEIFRQHEILSLGKKVEMQTRLFDEKTSTTKAMRTKETVDEYRYMPDPDIVPLIFSDELIEEVSKKYDRNYFAYQEKLTSLFESYSLKYDDSLFDIYWSETTRDCWKLLIEDNQFKSERKVKILAFWISEILLKSTKVKKLSSSELEVLDKSGLQAQEVKKAVEKWLALDLPMSDCLPKMMSNQELKEIIEKTLPQYPEQIKKYKGGELKIIQFLIGKIMSQTRGSAVAQDVSFEVENWLKIN